MSAPRGRGGASPGLLRRRYSVPETVMRKYKLAQQKSETDESEVGSAPSPRGWSPLRRGGGGARGRGAPRPSPLLRRLWGRLGGSHSELRYWDSCSASTDNCEACRKLSDKSVPSAARNDTNPYSPTHKLYRSSSRSPKKLLPFASRGFSPERYITHLENTRDMLLRESKSQITSPSLLASVSTPSERSSFKTASLTEGSPKLRLSSLATSSYPTTEMNSASDATSEITRSSTSYSSDDVTQSRSKISTRPETAGVSSTNGYSDVVSESPRKRRKSVCIYMNSYDSPTVEIRSTSITDSSAPFSQESCSNTDLDKLNTDKSQYSDPSEQLDSFAIETSSTHPTTTSAEKITTTETSNTTPSTLHRETSSPSDSAVSTQSSITTSSKITHDDNSKTSTPSSKGNKYGNDESKNYRKNNFSNREFSDTGISETIVNDCDSNKNYLNSNDDSDQNLSKSGSLSNSENLSTTEWTSDIVTCIENPAYTKLKQGNLKNSILECLEVVVSETLSSSAFLDQIKKANENQDSKSRNNYDKAKSLNNELLLKPHCNLIDIDQYVSNILIDSLNTMTDQINEINLNTDEDFKLSILEKEIKVKLHNTCASPLNLPSEKIMSSLLTQMPDKDLLETTIIEEQTHSLSYSTESKTFPASCQTEIRERCKAEEYQDEEKSYYLENSTSNLDENNIFRYSDMLQPQDCILNLDENALASIDTETFYSNDVNIQKNKNVSSHTNNTQFYLSDSKSDIVDKENNRSCGALENDKPSKAVLQKLNKMFENSTQSIDSNYNVCLDDSTNNLFCGSVYRDVSHLEMSTDVDVFVDNSLNKMMNSIDIEYNSDLSSDLNKNVCANVQISSDNCQNLSFNNNKEINENTPNKEVSDISNNILSNIGSGSTYQKPHQIPIVVPRFSAIPHSESMEVNTSSEEELSSCESDCLSMVDSLDDPNSPRFMNSDSKLKKKMSKHDNTPVRGDIIYLLPENTLNNTVRLPKERSETFFVPIKEDTIELETDKLIVAEHMPEKIKEKLHKRQQKRELRKEHYKRKKSRQLKRELENQKLAGLQKLRDEHEKDCIEILSQVIDQVVEKVNTEDDKMSQSLKQTKNNFPDLLKTKPNEKKSSQRTEKTLPKDGNNLNNFESFVVDKQGNLQFKNKNKVTPQENTKTESCDKKSSRLKNQKNNNISKPNPIGHNVKNNYEFQPPSYNPNLTGPRRLYQKTEFKEGNKHVEILEIVECIDSSPEPQSDDNQNYLSSSKHGKRSKIPVPVVEKFHRISKNKSLHKSYKRCRSPTSKPPFNISLAKMDQNSHMNTNSKMDQLIANILIDAFNEDFQEGKRKPNSLSSLQKKPAHPIVKKLSSSGEIPGRRASVPQQNPDKLASIPKYKQKFDAIPEEKSSFSIESSNEDVAKVNRRQSLPNEIKLQKIDNYNNNSDHPDLGTYKTQKLNEISETDENNFTSETTFQNYDIKSASQVEKKNTTKLTNVETQSSPLKTNKIIHDASTSPIPQFVSAATSPIPIEKTSSSEGQLKKVKGKQALGTRDGWAGFCRPQTGYSPEHEGSHPSSNPSDREAVEKINVDENEKKSAPRSQRILRTVDSRNNIKQISINHKSPTPENNNSLTGQSSDSAITKKSEEYLRNNSLELCEYSISDKGKGTKTTSPVISGKYSKLTEKIKYTSNTNRHTKDHSTDTDKKQFETSYGKISQKKVEIHLQKSESKESVENKRIKLPSPFMNESFSRSTDTTSSGSDSEVGVTCPALVPRWLPNNSLRQRRNVNRKNFKKEEPFRLPYQNVAGGWSVTLAGSCYTTLPSDVEMKVVFPKNTHQGTSQSDSGLGEEHHYRKQKATTGHGLCKKCTAEENLCQNCHISKSCSCVSSIRNQDVIEKENESFLPPALLRKVSKNSSLGHPESVEQMGILSKNFQYLPEVNTSQATKNKTKKSTPKMARRLSLHCWLPEDKISRRQKMANLELSQSFSNENEDELSVFGSAIMPEVKPRVPTMSERDLTRMHTAQFYSRNRRL